MPTPIETAIEHLQAERPAQAEAVLRRHLQRSPGDADANRLMGVALGRQGKVDQGKFFFERAVAADPGSGFTPLNYGNMYFGASRPKDAVPHLRRAAELMPESFEVWNSLAGAAAAVGEFDEAIAAAERACAIAPDHPQGLFNLGSCLTASGDAAAGIAAIEKAAALAPDDPNILTTLLMVSNYDPGRTAARRAEEHREIGARIAALFPKAKTDWPKKEWGALKHASPEDSRKTQGRDAPATRLSTPVGTRVRIGYLSYDLRRHVVAVFLRALFEHRDRAAFEVFAYHTGPLDEVSRELEGMVDHWVHAERMSDVQLVERIRRDGIDILVDLSGHTDGSRPGVLAMRGAPVQATYMGYPNTTGMPTVDYRIVDAITDPPPPHQADAWATEKLIRLPRCFLAYTPPADAPEVNPVPPSQRDGGKGITFGSFNAAAKINEPLLRLWARIVLAVPGSRLLIKNRGLSCTRTRAKWGGILSAAGLTPERFELRGWESSPVHHLAAYHEVDIALDSYPYHGTTTTCEALWMGVPVVTLAPTDAGHVSRVGASLLAAVGLPELVALREEEFVSKATMLALDQTRAKELRGTLRQRMAASALCDCKGLARGMEEAYTNMLGS